jgi:uncharacterized protein
MVPFVPLFRSPHLQTIAGHIWRRPPLDARFPAERRLFRTEPDVEVLVESHRPVGKAAGEIILVHGLEGSSASGYMRGLSAAALAAGFAAHRFNHRTCGGTEHLCQTLYHAGLTRDLLSVIRTLAAEGRGPFFLVGFSLGGNVVLKLAGELGESARPLIGAACAVSTPLDLAACARRIAEPDNSYYQRRFVRRMRARLAATGRFDPNDLARLHSVEAIDDRFTAPSFGFGNAQNYYRTQSALHYLDAIRIPTLLIQAKDDIFIPFEIFSAPAIRANSAIRLYVTDYGGHVGFIARRPHRFWLHHAIMEWIGKYSKEI